MTMVSSISGETKTLAKLVWRRLAESKGEMRTRRWTPVSPREQTEGEVAGDGEGGGLDAGFVAVLDFVDLDLEVLALAPADVHAHEHLGPVLGLGAACAGMDDDDGVERIGLLGEHGLGFELVGEFDQGWDLAGQVGFGVFALLGEFEVGFDVVGAAGEFGVVGEEGLEAFALAHQRLRT